MQTNPAVEQKALNGQRFREISPVGKEKGLWKKGFTEEPTLQFRMTD